MFEGEGIPTGVCTCSTRPTISYCRRACDDLPSPHFLLLSRSCSGLCYTAWTKPFSHSFSGAMMKPVRQLWRLESICLTRAPQSAADWTIATPEWLLALRRAQAPHDEHMFPPALETHYCMYW